jgi:putative tryptophan/tyrosine transport system substrate-binding protein
MRLRAIGLILTLALGMLMASLAVEAQLPTKVARIGFLTLLASSTPLDEFFIQQLRDLGYVEGQNLVIEYRRAAGKIDRLPALAGELVRLNVDVIVARATPAVHAAKNATTTIPIVMLGPSDAVGSGFVASLARPGGNITGTTNMMPELAGKRLELLREVLPRLARVAFLAYSSDPAHTLFLQDTQEAAERLHIQMTPVIIGRVEELDEAFSTMQQARAEALIVQPLFISNLGQGPRIAQLAVQHHLPTVSDGIPFAEQGGLMFYGPDQKPMFRRAATLVDKILKGAKPADIPVEQPTKFELVINLKTAKALGLTFPPMLLIQADEVIQ